MTAPKTTPAEEQANENPAQDEAATPSVSLVRLVDASGAEVAGSVPLGEAEQIEGNILTVGQGKEKTDYVVKSVEPGDPVTLRVEKARSNLHKTLLLMALLGAGWFVADWLVGLFVD